VRPEFEDDEEDKCHEKSLFVFDRPWGGRFGYF
jgi:hypothetical protein